MHESENTFPMDITDPSSRPWTFRPEGYLVVIMAGTAEAKRAEAALVGTGFAARDIKLYTGEQILDNHGVHEAQGCHGQGGGERGRRPGGPGTLPGIRA